MSNPVEGRAKFRFCLQLSPAQGLAPMFQHARLVVDHKNGKRYAGSDVVDCLSLSEETSGTQKTSSSAHFQATPLSFTCHLHTKQTESVEAVHYAYAPKVGMLCAG